MSDKLYSLPIEKLLKWILDEEKTGFIFGIPRELFFDANRQTKFNIYRYGKKLDTPLGVAAGPHTQMAQNIIAAWLTGSRYIELKTVQTLDELEITKPCIDMTDEGYNCEWSQELKIDNSFDEYLNAWIILHILNDKFFNRSPEEPGFIFNMSVGYDLQGIMKPNVQHFLNKMTNAQPELDEKIERLAKIYPRVRELNIPSKISNNVTLSTMHGCPPDEIESIANYLLTERKLNTAVKLNPTLLGKEDLRKILNDKLGYETIVPDEAFEHDLKLDDAIGIIERLTQTAKENGLEFGLKLTNTLESLNETKFLPKNEKMVYMSGRALHPISINLAAKLQNIFDGNLDISFSAGVDAFNIADVLVCGIKPVTVCSDLLKPGGYGRMAQYFDELESAFEKTNSKSIEEFIVKSSNSHNLKNAAFENLNNYAEKVLTEKRYAKDVYKFDTIKTERKLTAYDCIYAPCTETCAVSQDVPEYMWHTANGEYEKAFEAIIKANPLPNVTGMVCDHLCQTKCTRINYDDPLLIREIKRFVSDKVSDKFELQPKEQNGISVAVIGAGPSGLSAAYFLALEGCKVEVFESNNFAGGMPSATIPVFRINNENLRKDVENIEKLGVKFHFDYQITEEKFKSISEKYDYIYIAVGAQKGKKLGIDGENLPNILDQLEFLRKAKENPVMNIGNSVAIIGGGNSAMDAARTAKRIVGIDGKVSVIYRRTKKEMPADRDEIEALAEEGIEIIELTSPEKIFEKDGKLHLVCSKMKLGEKDSSGRAKPIKIDGSEFGFVLDTIITAIGQDTVLDFFPNKKLEIDEVTNETQIPNVFAGGDVVRGADSLINAVADGQKVAKIILERIGKELNIAVNGKDKLSKAEQRVKYATRKYGIEMPVVPIEKRITFETVHPLLTEEQAKEEAERCLLCNDVCNVCVTVCPNLANLPFDTEPFETKYPVIEFHGNEYKIVKYKKFKVEQIHQIINIGDFCNECGNCNTFCPTSGAPYKIKPKFYLTRESFENEDNCYLLENNSIIYKNEEYLISLTFGNSSIKIASNIFNAEMNTDDFSLLDFHSEINGIFDFGKVSEMIYLYKNLRKIPPFNSLH